MKTKILNLAMVFCLVVGSLLYTSPASAEAIDSYIWNDPFEPSIYDYVYLGVMRVDGVEWPADAVCHWNFGDGTTADVCYINGIKRFNSDGDYTVTVDATFTDGNTAFASKTIAVRTHDVAITKFTVPQSAKVGQTRQITVNVRNTRYPERVQVELYKIDDSNLVWVGTLVQDVPVRPASRTTVFTFNYTFTNEDARVGKATFRAMAFILENDGDDWPADNDVTALSTRVNR